MSKSATKPAVKPANTFSGLSDMLSGGFDDGLMSDESDLMVALVDIEVRVQVREEFEDAENSLNDLGESLMRRQIQSILIRPNVPGAEKPYLLVAGERRMRAAWLKGMTHLRARLKELTDAEAEDVQLEENIHRKNLTQMEEAKKIQRDLDAVNGDVDAVLAKHKKSRAWLSKIMALLHLPDQAKRLVNENISADLEVINNVRTIEKINPVKAKVLVDELKSTRGKSNARETVAKAKDEVKPPKPGKREPKADFKASDGPVATSKDRRHEEPSPGEIFAPAKTLPTGKPGRAPAGPTELLSRAYTNIFEFASSPKTVLDTFTEGEREAVDAWLLSHYEAGKQVKDLGRAIVLGLRNGHFSTDGDGALGLVAFLHGSDSNAKFNVLNILGSVKDGPK